MSTSATIRTLFVIQLAAMGAMEMSGPFWPLHLRTLTDSDWLFGVAATGVYVGPLLGVMLTSVHWGRIGDRHGHKPMVIRALLGLSITQLALACSTEVWMILALRFVQGACAGAIAPIQAYSVSLGSRTRRVRLLTYLQVATNVGSLMGALAGGLTLDGASFFWINLAASITCLVCAVAAWTLLPQVPPTRPTVVGTPAQAGRGGGLGATPVPALLTIIGILLMSRMITQTQFSLYVTTVFGVRNWLVGICYGLLALGFVTGAPFWARQLEGKRLPQVLPQIGCIAAACVALTALGGVTRHVAVFAAVHFIWGILLGATTPVLTSLASRAVAASSQGRVLGMVQSTGQFASITGIALGMWLGQVIGLTSTYFIVSASYATAVAVIVAVWRASRSRWPDADSHVAEGAGAGVAVVPGQVPVRDPVDQ
ncbi:MFS transporter [Micromonospora sp. HUAS LYJ1]|uniref:MFS transporter n=1 Tax=Micromonospora sp. HUAS LYJ1 TaxID=3061626 RepID=UPI00267367C4|nr:MFS transporter [Micromonospora sp. HUAS LYJ1]WKU05556.1 MFS transporter [Micromonospora sp. HUAS LYJ1]